VTPNTQARTASLKFPAHTSLRDRLNEAVDEYFRSKGISKHGGVRMWLKSLTVIAWAVASYVTLVFLASSWWLVLLSAVSLGLAVAGIGFNVQHDGGHGAYSSRRFGNRATARVLDLVGGSSYIWNFKHNIFHHQYTNVDGVDDDLEADPLLRLAPGQRRFWFHRFQHIYIWLLYGFLPPKWAWYDDIRDLITGRAGRQPITRPKGWDLAWMLVGKALYTTWVLVIPLLLHPFWNVLGVYLVVALVAGVTLSTVFQLAHCVEEADVTSIPEDGAKLPRSWAEHQLATTADFSPRNRLLSWYLGGLNFQVEHHLFPRICHVHYPALAPVIRGVCQEAGVTHFTHKSVWRALRSHVRHLKQMGRPVPA
jgi:linoleoyl-CoA desaturase